MNGAILLTQGNAPLLTEELVDSLGQTVDLTGCAVAFVWQGPGTWWSHGATVVDAAAGTVSYQFAAGETAAAGEFVGQWQVTATATGMVRVFPDPGGVILFRVMAALNGTGADPSNVVLVAQMSEPVRAVLGDHDCQFRKYSDDAICRVVRTCLRLGKVPGQWVTADLQGITPGIVQPRDLGLLTYHSALMFAGPEVADYRYETRALAERFGRQEHFLRELQNALYDLENGSMFSCFQTFYAWVNALTGVDVWSLMSDMTVRAPVATVNIGRSGITVATT